MAIPDIQKFSTVPQRTTVYAAAEMLKAAENKSVLTKFGSSKPMPRNKGETIVFRRIVPWNMQANGAPGSIDPATFQLAEGVNPPSYSLTYTDVPTTLKQFGVIHKFSSKTALLYEDKVVPDLTRQTGNMMADMLEYLMYGVVKAGTVVDYANGSSRGAVNTKISIEQLRRRPD